MKVGVVVDNELNSDMRVLREINILKENGHELFVLCFGFDGKSYPAISGISIKRINISRRLKNTLFFFQNFTPLYEKLWSGEIKKFITGNDIDILHVHDLYLSRSAHLGIKRSKKTIPLILDLHENYAYTIDTYNWTKGIIRRFFSRPGDWKRKEKEYLEYADRIIVLSSDFKTVLINRYPGLSEKIFAVLPNVPDLSQLNKRDDVVVKNPFNNPFPVIFYYGVIAERRGVFDALSVFTNLVKENYKVNLLLIGPVDKMDNSRFLGILNQEVLDGRVHYIPWIDSSLLPSYLGIADICIAPFHKNPQHESGVANKIYEYMGGSKPVVVSNCIPQQNLIEKHKCGLVFETMTEFKEALIRLIEESDLRVTLGKNGYEAILQNYNTGKVREDLISLYEHIPDRLFMKSLILITSQFPFGVGEAFIESEFPVLAADFDKVIIVAQNVVAAKTRKLPDNAIIYRYNPATTLKGFFNLPGQVISNFRTIVGLVKEELVFRKKTGSPLSVKNALNLLKKIIKAIQLKDFISRVLSVEVHNEPVVLYSYWLKTGAHAISLLDYRNSIKIARAHGSDLYEEKTSSEYLPLMELCARKLDAIFFISDDGRRYFSGKFTAYRQRFVVSRLGVNKAEYGDETIKKPEKFVIVSCSNLLPIKRIDLLIKSLELVRSSREIIWLHFGEGVLRNELEALAKEKLSASGRIRYSFMGYFPNDQLLKYYAGNRTDLFINTSSTEGIPVSIMEAQSFGIPVIATDVGGVREVVAEGTGTLLNSDFKPEELAVLIEYYASLSLEEENLLRKKALVNWETNFNASVNYKSFLIEVNSILASVTGKL